MKWANESHNVRPLILVKAEGVDGQVGWGECAALPGTSYFWEDITVAREALDGPIRERLLNTNVNAEDVVLELRSLEGVGPMAIAAAEMAILDAQLREDRTSLKDHLGVTADRVGISVVIGMPPDNSVDTLLDIVNDAVARGAAGVKLKIMPGWDVQPTKAVREKFRNIGIIVDTNESYENTDVRPLFELAQYEVLIEQPLHRRNIDGHVKLMKAGLPNVCFDEAIEDLQDLQRIVKATSGAGVEGIAVIKPARLGGMYSAAFGNMAERVHAANAGLQSDIQPLGVRFADVDTVTLRETPVDGTVQLWSDAGVGPAPNEDSIDSLNRDN